MTDYLNLLVPPKRESRLKPCIAYGGKLCGIEGGGKRCLETADRAFTQGSICLLLPALGTLASLPETAVLLHGAIGCGSSIHAGTAGVRSGNLARHGKAVDSLWFSTAMNESDVIGGGERKLERAIEEIDARYAPKTIVVVAACVPGVTGDDVEGVIAGVAPRVAARVLPVHCEGFKTRIWATAYDAYYHAFGRHLFDVPEGAEPVDAERAKRTVNLLNVSSMGRIDELELVRLLGELGLEVNIFPAFSEPREMYKVTQAALSISTCPTHDDYILTHLEEKYGIPYVLGHMPIGIANTGLWLRDIAAFFGLEAQAERIIAREEAELHAALERFRFVFEGKRALLSAGEFRALATASALDELGFDVVALRLYHLDEFAGIEYEKLLARIGGDAIVNVANSQPFEEANLLRRLKPDVFLGHLNDNSTASKLGIPTHAIYHVGLPYVGYTGVYELARRLYRHLKNPAFHRRLSEHAKLPYRESWYATDPFAYIRNVEAEVDA
jgi:nitrogenase molybdenum-iron protein alpha chain